MKIKFLSGTYLGNQLLVSCLVNNKISIDAGALAFSLDEDSLLQVKDIIITHTHLDHIASLPFIFSEYFSKIHNPIRVYATETDIFSLKQHIFNDVIWPDFTKMYNSYGSLLSFCPFVFNQPFCVNGINIIAIPVNHIVSTSGQIIDDGRVAVAFTSDTGVTDNFWEFLNQLNNLVAVFVDTAFSNSLESIALTSKHLTPRLLAGELKKLKKDVDVYSVNLKPMCEKDIMSEITSLNISRLRIAKFNKEYEW